MSLQYLRPKNTDNLQTASDEQSGLGFHLPGYELCVIQYCMLALFQDKHPHKHLSCSVGNIKGH